MGSAGSKGRRRRPEAVSPDYSVRRDKALFLSGCESRPATVVCGRLLNCKRFLSLLCICAPGALEFAGSVLRDSGAAPGVFLLFLLNEGQPSGWPAGASRTVGRGSHPQGPGAERRTRKAG